MGFWTRNQVAPVDHTRAELEGVRNELRELGRYQRQQADRIAELQHQMDSMEAAYALLLDATAPLEEASESGFGWSGGEGPAADHDAIRAHLRGRIEDMQLSDPGAAVTEEIVRKSLGRHVNQGWCPPTLARYWPHSPAQPWGSSAAAMFFAEDLSVVWIPTLQGGGPWARLDGEAAATILSPQV
jgi:hypothetical protein